MNNINIGNIMSSAQIATALAIIAFAVVVTLLHRQIHKHKQFHAIQLLCNVRISAIDKGKSCSNLAYSRRWGRYKTSHLIR